MKYVAAFMFDESVQNVALIKKTKPDWQKGLFNGIGGKVENGETSLDAVVREFHEEAGLLQTSDTFHHFSSLRGLGFEVDFYYSIGDLSILKSMTEEEIHILPVDEIKLKDPRMVENLPYLISIAIDIIDDGRPSFVDVYYS